MHACLVVSKSLQPHGLQPAKLLCGIFQAKIVEQVNISYIRGSSWHADDSNEIFREFHNRWKKISASLLKKIVFISFVEAYWYFDEKAIA